MDCVVGSKAPAAGLVEEWTTPSEKRFSVHVSPFVACIEVVGSDEDGTARDDMDTSHTPRARPNRSKIVTALTSVEETKSQRKKTNSNGREQQYNFDLA